ncbi:MAG TPA: hypothetical protein VMV04_17780 [Thermodesulfobacteriota bacterium]|nr:hypothetical protein [Thermodesulfobacteriota bacterium]
MRRSPVLPQPSNKQEVFMKVCKRIILLVGTIVLFFTLMNVP